MGKPRTPQEMGKKGGKARAAHMTPEERSQSAREAARARWKDKATPAESAPPVSPEDATEAT